MQGVVLGGVEMRWESLPEFPVQGVAGPFTGGHKGVLLVAGGTNFQRVEAQEGGAEEKVWQDAIFVLPLNEPEAQWSKAGKLSRPLAYGATVSTPQGVLCLGGNEADSAVRSCFLLQYDGSSVREVILPELPAPCAFGRAAVIGGQVYLAGGQRDGLDTALHNFWMLDLSVESEPLQWRELPAWPGAARTLNLTQAQFNGEEVCVYVISGRTGSPGAGDASDLLQEVYEYSPSANRWRRKKDIPQSVYAGAAAAVGRTGIVVLSGVDQGSLQCLMETPDRFEGFPRVAWFYDAEADRWECAGETPENQIVTPAISYQGKVYLACGEIAPRKRSRKVWQIEML